MTRDRNLEPNMSSNAAERFHALDAVRGGALLLGIAVHLSMSFWPIPLWPIRDSDPSQELLASFFVMHIFRMALFFTIAGFFARLMFKKRGPLGFIKDRAKRIGIPFLVGWPLLVIAVFGIIIAYSIASLPPGAEPPPPPPTPTTPIWTWIPLAHTWFLYVLLWLYVGILGVVGVLSLIDRKGLLGRLVDPVVAVLVKSHLAPLVLSVPLFAVFFFDGSWIMWGGIRTPDMGLIPNLAASVGYATAFGFGWLLHRQPELLNVWKRWWPLHLAAAAGLSLLAMNYSALAATPAAVAELGTLDRLLSSAVYPLAIWTWSFGLIGAAMAFLSKQNNAIRYIADSSYWLYLIHLPVVMAFQIVFANVGLPWFVKFPIMLVLAFALMLASYQLLVRNTPIGGLLNGRRYGKAKPSAATPAPSAQPSLT
jgi:peptidoglycan/LPS O-acetylase OafA/YrhL